MDVEVISPLKFEGNEKAIEIGFKKNIPQLRAPGSHWEVILANCGASILKKLSTPFVDAYILSESSLFVWDDYIYLITCGKTRPLNCLESLFKFIDQDQVNFFLYSRKNLNFPGEQPSDFAIEEAQASFFFPGRSYRLGSADLDHFHFFHWSTGNAAPEKKISLKILMSDIDPDVGDLFCLANSGTPFDAERRSGLTALFPGTTFIDNHLFSPMGYSANGIINEDFFTVHVTPQQQYSYASFETNITETRYSDLIQTAVRIFKPSRFSVVVVASTNDPVVLKQASVPQEFSGYTNSGQTLSSVPHGYKVTFLNFLNARNK